MPLELKQQLKLTQQLVMTPQLQQAIQLLQLTRMELTDVVRDEMMENPLLEDAAETDHEQSKEREEFDAGGRSEATVAAAGETELAPVAPAAPDREAEVKLG